MTTLREAAWQALEALEEATHYTSCETWSPSMTEECLGAATALRAALAQQEKEPVLVVEKEPDYMSRGHFYEGSKPFIDPTEVWKLPIGTKLFTHQPRRDWQSLSKDESLKLWGTRSDGPSNSEIIGFARAIEAKLKEKNNA